MSVYITWTFLISVMARFIFSLKECFHLLEEFGRKHEIIEILICASEDVTVGSGPVAMSFIDEYYMLADAQHGVHVVGVDYRGDSIFVGDIAKQFIDQYGSARIEAGVWFVAKEIFRI